MKPAGRLRASSAPGWRWLGGRSDRPRTLRPLLVRIVRRYVTSIASQRRATLRPRRRGRCDVRPSPVAKEAGHVPGGQGAGSGDQLPLLGQVALNEQAEVIRYLTAFVCRSLL